MINHTQISHTLRAQLVATAVCSTGGAAIAATAGGYSRAAGSFLTDGFAVGMEVNASGFTTPGNNGLHVIQAVDALTITCSGTSVEAGPGALAVGLPALRAWETIILNPTIGRWYIEEDYIPGPVEQITMGQRAVLEGLPMYVIRLYAPSNIGTEAPYAIADAILAQFPPMLDLTLPNNDVVRVRTRPAPNRGQLSPADPGRVYCVIAVPLRIRSTNII